MSDALERKFPNLRPTGYERTSDATSAYNCIAWAAGDSTRWWAPWVGAVERAFAYWPAGLPGNDTLDGWTALFTASGYEPCADAAPEPGVDKVALYAQPDGRPTHVARQLPDGAWTSKLGENVDIRHALAGLEGEAYGAVVRVLRRVAAR